MPFIVGSDSSIHRKMWNFSASEEPWASIADEALKDPGCIEVHATTYQAVLQEFASLKNCKLEVDELPCNVWLARPGKETTTVRAKIIRRGQLVELITANQQLETDDLILLCPLIC